jgi:hypothetical protein
MGPALEPAVDYATSERLEEIVDQGLADLLHHQQQISIGGCAYEVGQRQMGERWLAEAIAGLGVHLALWSRDFEAETSRLAQLQRWAEISEAIAAE